MLQMGVPYTVQVSDVEEVITEREPARVVEELSRQKAAAVAQIVGQCIADKMAADVAQAIEAGEPDESVDGTQTVGQGISGKKTVVVAQAIEAGEPDESVDGTQTVGKGISDNKVAVVTQSVTEGMSRQEAYVVIGADTVVACDGEILGKPKNREEARRMLQMLQGRTHQVYTGVTLCTGDRGAKTFHEATEVTFYPMSEAEIGEYLNTKDLVNPTNEDGTPRYEWADKAGAYAVQGACSRYIQEIQGDYFNVVGLPVARLYHEMRAMHLISEDVSE